MTDLDARMRALRSRTRREILTRIWDRDLAAGEIAAAFALTPATISEHLGRPAPRRPGRDDQGGARPGATAPIPPPSPDCTGRSRTRASGARRTRCPSRT